MDLSGLICSVCTVRKYVAKAALSGCGYDTAREGERRRPDAVSKRNVLFPTIQR